MKKEWNSPYNPFNSRKALIWREHFEGCSNLDFLSPVTVSIDPSNRCNFNCIWCNAYKCMQCNQDILSKEHLIRLADFYADWGIKSVCVAGGGEPFMNPGTGDMLLRLKENGIKCAPVTNGSLLSDELIDIIANTSRWTGISMDAGCCDTYLKVKGITNPKIFDIVIDNIRKLTKRIKELKTECEVGYKFLLHPLNAQDIFIAAKLAKEIGIHDFQLRPVGWDNISKTQDRDNISFDGLLEVIDYQIEEAMELDDENFHVYGIRHKFKPNFLRKVEFKRCWASSIAALVFGADGNCYLCLDHRGDTDMILCSHFPQPSEVLKYWNTDIHRALLQRIDPEKCPRCTIGPYNEMVEQVFIEDRMCRYFL